MADILVQNAVQDVANTIQASGSGINYASILGETLLARVTSIVQANKTNGPYTASGSATLTLCVLNTWNCISHCQCSFSGSGSTQTNDSYDSSPWRNGSVLAGGAPQATAAQIRAKYFALDSGTVKIESLYNANNDQVTKDLIVAHLTYGQTTTDNDEKLNWYGEGGSSSEKVGARLSDSNYLKICNSNWKYGEGPATCTWAVPAGATRVKFQVWGAGQGSNPACCCGGTNSGGNGSYAELTMDATPGDSYSICAGCSCKRYCCSSDTPGYGCASGVTGPGICCLIAHGDHCYNGNCGDHNALRACIGQPTGSTSGCQRYQNPYCTTSGPCWCSYGEYCYDNSCATCGVVPIYPSYCSQVPCSCACGNRNATHLECSTLRTLRGGGCLETNNYGYHIRPPIIDADTGLMFDQTVGCYKMTFTSGTCCGGCNAKDWDTHPGHGGAATHVMGGTNQHKGDTGRAGMVQISWT